jgi:hypothetical protein
MGRYLHGCANVAMARTPQQALAALHKTQTSLLRDSADTVAQVTWLWRKQNTELFVIRVEHAPAPQSEPAQATRVDVEYQLPRLSCEQLTGSDRRAVCLTRTRRLGGRGP